MKHVVINATNFKATCLALLDEIDQHGGTVTITKRGRPVATLNPPSKKAWKSSKGILAGKIKIIGDIVNFQMDWGSPEEILNPPAPRATITSRIGKRPARILA